MLWIVVVYARCEQFFAVVYIHVLKVLVTACDCQLLVRSAFELAASNFTRLTAPNHG